MKIVKDRIAITQLEEMSSKMFGDLVKAVVDTQKNIMAVDAPLHADLMEFLLQQEHSEPQYLWGINLYPKMTGEDFLEFDSMINLKPGLGNRSRGVESSEIKEKIKEIVSRLVQ